MGDKLSSPFKKVQEWGHNLRLRSAASTTSVPPAASSFTASSSGDLMQTPGAFRRIGAKLISPFKKIKECRPFSRRSRVFSNSSRTSASTVSPPQIEP